MSVRKLTPFTKRIIGLFPDLLGVGGIQEAGRLTVAALDEIAHGHDWHIDFLSLNDSPGRHSLRVDEREIDIRGFGRAKMRFVLSGMADARAEKRAGTSVVLALHPNLALLA